MIQPRGDYVVIEKVTQEMSAGGIYIPTSKDEENPDDCYNAKILAIGPLVKDLKVGDDIVVGMNMGIEYKPESVELVREIYVLAILGTEKK